MHAICDTMAVNRRTAKACAKHEWKGHIFTCIPLTPTAKKKEPISKFATNAIMHYRENQSCIFVKKTIRTKQWGEQRTEKTKFIFIEAEQAADMKQANSKQRGNK